MVLIYLERNFSTGLMGNLLGYRISQPFSSEEFIIDICCNFHGVFCVENGFCVQIQIEHGTTAPLLVTKFCNIEILCCKQIYAP